MMVVLPQPEGPRMEKNDPRGTEKDTSSTAVVSPKRLVRSVHSRSGVIGHRRVISRRKSGARADAGPPAIASVSVGGLHAVQHAALDGFQPGGDGRIPLDVVDGFRREAGLVLRLQLVRDEFVGALGRGEVAGGFGDHRRDFGLHHEVDPVIGRLVGLALGGQREGVDPAQRAGGRARRS